MMIRALRHSRVMPTDAATFAWLDDLITTMWNDPRRCYQLKKRATVSEVLYCVENYKAVRFQVVYNSASNNAYSGLIRAVQGHSKEIHERMNVGAALVRVPAVTVLVHYTNQKLWAGFSACIPAELFREALRLTAATSTARSPCPIPRVFSQTTSRKKGTDTYIQLDAQQFAGDYPLSR